MARKAKKQSENAKAQVFNPNSVDTTPTVKPHLIVAKRIKSNRWYVYFQGVAPEHNVGCGCKTAKSAMRYMHLLKYRFGAVISQNIYDRLAFEAQREG